MVDLKIAFKRFSQLEAKGQSNLYEYLTLEISKDPELLQIALVIPPEQPAPNLFLAAVHWLLMKNSNEPLTNYYPHLSHIPSPDKGSYDVFRRFVLRKRLMYLFLLLLNSLLCSTNMLTLTLTLL